ncbi:G-protein coupled receptor moody-like [Amblyomma americanum]
MEASCAGGAFVIAVAVAGTAGNALTIAALALRMRREHSGNASSVFILSLSAADLCFCSLNLPFAASGLLRGAWTHGPLLCRLVAAGRYLNVGVSLLSITAIAVNRYVLVVRPSLYSRLYGRAGIWWMAAATWLAPCLLLAPTLAGTWGRFGPDSRSPGCSVVASGGRSPKAFLFVAAFLVPCLAIVYCYAAIFRHARKARLQLEAHGEVASRRQDEWRITRMVLVIFLSFLACYLPITIVKVVDAEVRHPSAHLGSQLLLYLSACINPVIYGVTNRQYRRAYAQLLGSVAALCCSLKPFQAEQTDGKPRDSQQTSL